MKTKRTIRTAAFAAILAAWCGWGMMEARGQADAWITSTAASNGTGSWTNMLGTPSPAVALPTPGGALGYNGQAARYSQHIRTNGSGQLIFFEVDGKLFDGDGQLIADAKNSVTQTPDCQECLWQGMQEFVSVPVPGSCGLYYLLSATPNGLYDDSFVQVALLDMNADNPRFASAGSTCNPRKGRLVKLMNQEPNEEELQYPQLANWFGSTAYTDEPATWLQFPLSQALRTSDYVGRLEMAAEGKSQSPLLRVVAGNAPGSPSWLFVIHTTRIFVYKVAADGITLVTPLPDLGFVPTSTIWDPATLKTYYRDADARILADGSIRLVLTSNYGHGVYPGQLNDVNNLVQVDFSTATGQVLPATGGGYRITAHELFNCPLSQPANTTGLAGCALRSDGAGAYLVGRVSTDCQTNAPWFGFLEFASGLVTDLTANLPNVAAYTTSRFYRNRSSQGGGESIFITHGSGVDEITGIAPGGTLSVISSSASGTFAPQFQEPPGASLGSPVILPRFLAIGVQGDQHLSPANLSTCCSYFQTVPGAVVGGHTQLPGMQPTIWTPTSNPLQPGSAAMVFNCDLIVETGASLTLIDLTLRFTNGAKVVVRRGGFLSGYSTNLSGLECPGAQWPGIRVEGNSADITQSNTSQGAIKMDGCTVQNALVGLWCAQQQNINSAVDGFFGGRVLAENSTFRDCINGVRITNYHRYVDGSEVDYFAKIHNCTFETTADWPGGTPGVHVELNDVNGPLISNSRFVNQVPQNWNRWNRGVGIRSYDAAFRCLGSGNPNNRFESLTAGVVAMVPDPAEVYKVDGMRFFNNSHGLLDWGSTGGAVTNNSFTTMANTPGLGQASVGLSLFNSEGYTVERNTFTDQGTSVPSVGIHFTGQSYQNNEVYDNEFNNLNVGCLVEGRHAAYNAPAGESLVPGLQMRCGDHLGNLADQLIYPNGWVRHNQGLGENTQKLANNRFLSSVTCDPGNNSAPSVHTYMAAWQPTGLYVNYHYYKHADSPEQRQDCIELEVTQPGQDNWLSLTGQYFYDLNGHGRTQAFEKERDCNSGKLDPPGNGGGMAGLQAQYSLRQAELANAWQNYNGTMDRMKTGDLVGMIHYQPWHPSYLLRDTLLGNHPLTDSVMLSMLKREWPMDAWHLTQVLIQNSPLSPWVWQYIDEQNSLPTYFRSLLKQFDQGMSLKQVLEQEIVSRQQEVQFTKVLLLDSLANDSTVQNRLNLVDGLLQADVHGDGLRGRYLLALLNGDYAKAAQLATDLAAEKGVEGLLDWGSKYMALQGDWAQATTADRDELYQMAMNHAPSGGALAWATLYQLAELDSLPTPELPVLFKSLPRGRNSIADAAEIPLIGVMPNPARDRVAFTVPPGMEEGRLELMDAQGRLVRTISLAARTGLVEADVRKLGPGLYVVSLVLGEHRLGTAKLSIVE